MVMNEASRWCKFYSHDKHMNEMRLDRLKSVAVKTIFSFYLEIIFTSHTEICVHSP